MENNILLSIAIPTYNRADCLKNLLTNILAQAEKIKEGVQICISNNSSTDNTRKVVMSFMEKYPGLIKYHENEKNLGFDKNILLVMEMADGQFVWTFGDDDIIVENGLAEAVAFLKDISQETTGLIMIREEQYFIDSVTKKKVICLSTVDPLQPKVFTIPRKEIIGLTFPDIVWISANIFNNRMVKKMFAEDRVALEEGVGTVHAQLLVIVFMFLKYPKLQALAFNERHLVEQELARYKSFIEDKFVVHYQVQKKLNQLYLAYKYIDKDSALLIINNDKKLIKWFIIDMLVMKVFKYFRYLSYKNCIKLFFQQAKFIDAVIFSFIFSILFLIPSEVLVGAYKLLLMVRYKKEWKSKWNLNYQMISIAMGGTRRRMSTDSAT